MDSSEKIQQFGSFYELRREIMRDRDTREMLACRYAVRFIMLNNFNEFREQARFMSNIGVAALDLEEVIEDGENDTWITKDMLRKTIEQLKCSTFVTPFSELVRFYDDDEFRGFFNEIMLLEDTSRPEKRIYLPLIGLQNRFTDFLNHFARAEESGPVWCYNTEPQRVEVFVARFKNFSLPRGEVQCQLDSLREWLRFWKVQAPQDRLVCTSRPVAAKYGHSKPDNIFNFTPVANAYEFLTRFVGLPFPFEHKPEEDELWHQLLLSIDKQSLTSFSFFEFVRRYFNKITLDATEVISLWGSSGSGKFERWLLSKYVMGAAFAERHPYMALCMEMVVDFSDSHLFVEQVASRLIYETDASRRTAYATERRQVMTDNADLFRAAISQESQNRFFERIREVFQKEGNLHAALELVSGVFDFERILLMGWLANYPDRKPLVETIHAAYPELEAYLTSRVPSHFRPENQWFVEYMKAYKVSKLRDKPTDGLKEALKTKNASSSDFYKWYFQFEETHDVLASICQNGVLAPDRIYWIDGLGAEHFSFILYLLEHKDTSLKVVRSQFTRSCLPTSTHHNRFDGEKVRKFGALDELGHNSHGYQYLYTLAEELRILEAIMSEILNACRQEKCTVAIVSDHGMSCLSRKAPSRKYEGKFEHEGRYIETDADANPDSDYLVHRNEADGKTYKIALTHSSLSKVPTHEVHGGCTPEEVIVPFLLLSNKDVASRVRQQVNLLQQEVLFSNPVVTVTVIPEPESVRLLCDGKSYEMSRDGILWTALLQDISEGAHAIEIQPKGAESTSTTIHVVGLSGSTDIESDFDL